MKLKYLFKSLTSDQIIETKDPKIAFLTLEKRAKCQKIRRWYSMDSPENFLPHQELP
jgi:hypothetical protein